MKKKTSQRSLITSMSQPNEHSLFRISNWSEIFLYAAWWSPRPESFFGRAAMRRAGWRITEQSEDSGQSTLYRSHVKARCSTVPSTLGGAISSKRFAATHTHSWCMLEAASRTPETIRRLQSQTRKVPLRQAMCPHQRQSDAITPATSCSPPLALSPSAVTGTAALAELLSLFLSQASLWKRKISLLYKQRPNYR